MLMSWAVTVVVLEVVVLEASEDMGRVMCRVRLEEKRICGVPAQPRPVYIHQLHA